MQPADWIFVAVPLLLLVGIGIYTQSYVKGVADFLSGGRHAGRYLLAVSQGEMALGAVCFVGAFEQMSGAGFTLAWWGWITAPIGTIVSILGFVLYRYRETRAMTLAQFFEIRYSKSFRVFTGILAFVAGIVNFGIMPVVSARFLTYFMGFPATVHLFAHAVPTYIIVMGTMLSITTFLALAGGIITLLVVGCLEGIMSQVMYLVIIFSLVMLFPWSDINHVLTTRPAGQSMVNPFDSFGLKNFNFWYVGMALLVNIYGTMAWQNQSAFNSAARSPHEARMGSLMGRWRDYSKGAVIPLLAVCGLTFLHHPHFAAQSAQAHAEISAIANPETKNQMAIPIALQYLLPAGVKGALCIVLLMGSFGGDSSQIHSWGSIFVQDVIVPLRRKPFTPRQHLRLLRLAIICVALFAFLFGSLYRQVDYIFMWWAVTMSLFVGGAGAAIIGGLYWKKGTTAGAWAALLTGSSLATGGILAQQFFGARFPLNGMQISFFASLTAVLLYVVISLLTCREDFNMDRMLHRGKYAQGTPPPNAPLHKRFTWAGLAGFDKNFTRGDKWVAGALLSWTSMWSLIAIGGSVWNLIAPWPTAVWSQFWHLAVIGVSIFLAVVATGWFVWGGTRDIRELFRRLRLEKVNILDNGMVVDHQNLDETAKAKPAAPVPERVLHW